MEKGKTVLIMGLGLHGGGVGAANYFTSLGYRVVVTDLKTREELESSLEKLRDREKIRLVLGRHDFKDFRNADLIIKNPGVPPRSPHIEYARKHGVRIETDVGIFLEYVLRLTNNIVGVTGTKGKSTTAAMVHKILCARNPGTLIAGNITIAVLDILKDVKKDSNIVLELSSFQLGGIRDRKYSPRVAVFTNFLNDHMNYYKNMDEYFEDKAVIFRYQREGDILVINREDEIADMVQAKKGVRLVSFGIREGFKGEGSFVRGNDILYWRDGKELRVMGKDAVRVPGSHNLYNTLAAVSTAIALGLEPEEIESGIRAFSGLEHRLEYVTSKEGVQFYNDSAATTPDAAIAGIMSLEDPITLIAGGHDKGLELRKFIDVIALRVKNLLLIEGTGTRRFIKEARNMNFTLFNDLKEAVYRAWQLTEPGGKVLLSPGFASFGMFSNEFERGRMFKELVLSL